MQKHKREKAATRVWLAPQIPVYINNCDPVDIIIKQPSQADAVFREMWPDDAFEIQEQWTLMALNLDNQVIGTRSIQTGHITPRTLDNEFLLTMASISGAERIIVARNKPVRTKATIPNDLMVLQDIHFGMRLLNIQVMDFIILYANAFLSFYEDLKEDVPNLPLIG